MGVSEEGGISLILCEGLEVSLELGEELVLTEVLADLLEVEVGEPLELSLSLGLGEELSLSLMLGEGDGLDVSEELAELLELGVLLLLADELSDPESLMLEVEVQVGLVV